MALTAPARGEQTTRILTLDAIRGVAVMGILLMNIVAFAMPEAAYSNPYAYGGHRGADFAAWLLDYVLVDGKMRGLFSFLFGASTLLVIERAEAKGESPAVVHYWRMAWLFAFGMAHFVLLWWGDILSHYALVGCVAFLFRKLPPYKLVTMAVLLLVMEFVLVHGAGQQIAAQEAAVRAGYASAEVLRGYATNRLTLGVPTAAEIAQDLALHRGSYAGLVGHRWADVVREPVQTFIFLGPETLGYMLLGMAGLRSGMLTGAWSRRRYLAGALIGFGTGLPAYSALAMIPIRHGFDVSSVAASALVWSEPFRPIMICGWACLILLLIRPGGWLTERLAAVGRMAFSNYLGTTIVCTTLFYGYGFGLYGELSRASLYCVVVLIWLTMLIWSAPWLARFRYGPFEWLWRSLARRRLQPMVRQR
ncbi:MAG: DUF418 domain-containing protein [Sphingomonas sp.]